MSLLTPQGINKLMGFIKKLNALKESFKPKDPNEISTIPISSPYSFKTLNDMIKLCEELVEHNKLLHWKASKKEDELRAFFSHFDGNMNNFAPACFDKLSYEMAKIFLEELSKIDTATDLSFVAKSLPLSLPKLIPFVIDNTAQLIKLYEFVADELRQSKNLSELEPPELNKLYNCIRSTMFLLKHMHKPDDVYDEMIKHYCRLFYEEGISVALPPLTVEVIIKKYEERVALLLPNLLQRPISEMSVIGISTACVDEPTRIVIGQLIGPEPIIVRLPTEPLNNLVDCFDSIYIESGFKGCLLLSLLLNEKKLLDQLSEQGEKISCNGIIATLKNSFDHAQYQDLLGRFKQCLVKQQQELNKYLGTPNYLKKNDNKRIIAQRLVEYLSGILNEINDLQNATSLNKYLGRVFRLFLKASFTHNVIIGEAHISHGDLGKIFTAALNELYGQLKEIRLNVIPDIFSDVLSKDEYERMLNGDNSQSELSSSNNLMPVPYNKVNSKAECHWPWKKIVLNSQLPPLLPSVKTVLKHHMWLNSAIEREAKSRKEMDERKSSQLNNQLAIIPFQKSY